MDILKILLFAPVSIIVNFQPQKLSTYIQYIKNNIYTRTTKKTTKKALF